MEINLPKLGKGINIYIYIYTIHILNGHLAGCFRHDPQLQFQTVKLCGGHLISKNRASSTSVISPFLQSWIEEGYKHCQPPNLRIDHTLSLWVFVNNPTKQQTKKHIFHSKKMTWRTWISSFTLHPIPRDALPPCQDGEDGKMLGEIGPKSRKSSGMNYDWWPFVQKNWSLGPSFGFVFFWALK